MEIIPIPLLVDNYAFLIRSGGLTLAIDPSTAAPVLEELGKRQWDLHGIVNTHHHWDHTGGNLELKARFQCPIWGPAGDRERIAGMDHELSEGFWQWGNLAFEVLFIPGHTRHHVALWLAAAHAVFTGDTLFLLGCGRLFEGTPAQMWHSLSRLAGLPDSTQVWCAHEYTQDNGRFALSLSPDDKELQERVEEVRRLRALGKSTIPGNMAQERRTNPFLRVGDPVFRKALGLAEDPVAAFADLRERKNTFR